MQFTELSELNHVVGLMRLAACNSPTFHDRQDSEVDRIYNSSPKMESQLRNSWIDKMTAFKPLPASSGSISGSSGGKRSPKALRKTNSGSGTAIIGGKVANGNDDVMSTKSRVSTANGGKEGDMNGRANGAASSTASRRRTSTQVASRSEKKTAASGNATNPGDNDAANDSDKKQPDDGFIFEKEEVQPLSYHEASLLDKALKGPSAAPMGPRPPMMGADGGAVLHLTIYLPTRDEMKIDLYDVSTVDESIQELLRAHQAESRQPALYYGHPECYELRLHDTDGYPDEDFPGSLHHRFGLGVPKSDDYTVVAIDGTTVGQDLLPTLNKKHRLQLFQELYVLKISEAERERLDLASDEIDMHTKLRPLNLHEVTLATSTKIFADAPQISLPAPSAVEETPNVDSRTRPPPETFMFNDVTAAMFKEWHVIKKNKYGKKQQRMLGIDLNKIYNRKVGERVITSSKATKIVRVPTALGLLPRLWRHIN
ncbi:hypothetical protein BBJ28_00006593 [Nothophytophthora sp. Chile5]|nr:hypothetical protein BBJ28_00006593 [Nothophytophthora sp. Chile5]